MSEINKRDQLIKQWIKETAEMIEDAKEESLKVEEKSARNDLVTNMDKQIEEALTNKIRSNFPEDRICGEEGFGDNLEDLNGTVWFIDPIDGTLNFVLQQENFAVMIAVYEEGKGVQGYIYDVTSKKLYHGIKGQGVFCNDKPLSAPENKGLSEGLMATNSQLMTQDAFSEYRVIAGKSMGVRMLGSAGLEVIELIKGNVIAYVATKLSPWDIAPGKIMLEEFGYKISNFSGEPVNLLKTNQTIFSTARAFDEIVTNK
ncbi:inositol monophosphatase family protein [Marinilactibacillus kalidii]|uniref:inositol monophosphatase family protein n=1 Tax=Marinilactibacillus kalidii TaxID=2820274 RepID=UPI001ABDC6E1|nr:inositol monophosphatase family protein [Marinilactibacillus kalidii]